VALYLVTGATGRVGRALVAHLAAQGLPVRALARRATEAAWPAGVQPVDGDLARPDTLDPALAGVGAVFLFTPLEGPGELAARARLAGVQRGVLLSSIATQKADPRENPIAARHLAAERALAASGLPSVVLRPDTFAANALDWAPSVRQAGLVRLAYPQSRRVPIHEQDLAEIAALALVSHEHVGQAWWLTGPRQVSQAEQVEAIALAIARPLQLGVLSEDEALAQWCTRMPEQAARRLLDYLRKCVDQPPAVSPQLAQVLGRPGRDFSAWALDHRADFGACAQSGD